MDNRSAYILLNMIQGISPGKIHSLLKNQISPADLFRMPDDSLRKIPGMTEKILLHLKTGIKDIDFQDEIEKAARAGIRILTPEDEDYPQLLLTIYDPPLCLYVRGSIPAVGNSQNGIAMVGSRHTTAYGEKMGRFLAAAAASANWPVVSGLARGMDTVVHRAVLDNFGCTIAVLGSGLFRVYPPENLELAREICDQGGAVISEFPLQTGPDRYNFPIRNRLISGLTRGTVVIEAGLQSGSLITAKFAAEQNRVIFAVPGRADQPFSQGCHALLRDGAVLTENFQDILDEFALLPGLRQSSGREPGLRPHQQEAVCEAEIALPELEYRIWEILKKQETTLDELISALDAPAPKVISTVLIMEMKKIITQLPGKRIVANPDKKIRKMS